jgi:D-alanine-D-alanine ligase
MGKINVAVLFGGVSSEYEVSLISASSVMNNIPDDKYNVIPVGITKDGRWYLFSGEDMELVQSDNWCKDPYITPAYISPDRSKKGLTVIKESGEEVIPVDVVFPVLHGQNGEDGAIQGLFQLADIPFVGCDMTSSAVSMDKIFTNTVADKNKIKQAKWVYTTKTDFNRDEFIKSVEEVCGYPCFIKPAVAGSSVGISKANNRDELIKGFDVAFNICNRILVEEGINGLEIECAVLGNSNLISSEVGQISPVSDFYDYEAKYITGNTALYIPAKIEDSKKEEIKALSQKVFKVMGCKGLSRIDFFVDKKNGTVYFNELNTMPGFTSISMYPKLFAHSGIPYPELLDRLITLGIEEKKN